MAPSSFVTPDPNGASDRAARNLKLSNHLAANSKDITDIYLETLPSGATRWKVVHRDGSVATC